jgi:lipid A 4'-phosphatase
LSYLRSRRGRVILACFLASSLLLLAFPKVDIQFSGLFFHHGFHWSELWWQPILRDATTYVLIATMVAVLGIYGYNKWSKRKIWGLDGKRVVYLCLVLLLGAGLIVNVAFKENFGRARPRDVAEFGGSKIFTPAFVVSRECSRNCSFSSGEGAAGFFTLALAFAFSRRRRAFALAAAIGIVISLARIASGAHFLSDTVVSFFVMLLVADVLFYYIVMPKCMRKTTGKRAPVPESPPPVIETPLLR